MDCLAFVGNSPSISQSTLDRINKVKQYIKIKTYNTISLRFWGKSGIKCLTCVRLMSHISRITISTMTITNGLGY